MRQENVLPQESIHAFKPWLMQNRHRGITELLGMAQMVRGG
jgi:hypothetical protein